MRVPALCVFSCLLIGLSAQPATAQQPIETVGSRALGMGGAFVGVSDDPTASFWNPAGLPSGRPAGLTIESSDFRTGNQKSAAAPGQTRRRSYFASLGTWPLGVTVGRFRDTRVSDVTAGLATTETLATSQYGVTLLQTITHGLVVATNLKWVRGTVTTGSGSAVSAASVFGRPASEDSRSGNSFALDLGVMADFERARIGLVLKNLRQPGFTNVAGTSIKLPRLIRVGVSVLPSPGLTLALDADLDTVDLWDGPRRMIAAGVEKHLGQRAAARAGVRWNLKDPEGRHFVYATGGSVRISPSLWADAHYTYSDIARDRGFGAALRAAF
jgi:hypothetical protein